MKLPGRGRGNVPAPYAIHPPYAEARAELLSRRPGQDDSISGPSARLFAVVADLALDGALVTVYLLADGTISIYSSDGIHSTGLRGSARVVSAAAAIFEDVADALGEFARVEDIRSLALPGRGDSRILVRTWGGDFAASEDLGSNRVTVGRLAAMALLLVGLARAAVIEGFDRVEAGEVGYQLDPEYRRLRSTLMDWVPGPEQPAARARVASVVMEVGEADARTVTSLFALADGSTSVYRSDGTLARGLSGEPCVVEAARRLLDSVDAALPAFGRALLTPPPQPGQVQFVIRARLAAEGEWSELVAVVSRVELESGSHPLSGVFREAGEVLDLAGVGCG